MSRDTAGVIAPPPLIYLGMLALGLLIDWLIDGPSLGLGQRGRWLVAVPLLATGVTLIAAALRRFRSAGTDPEPWKPSTALVIAGVYKLTRNPMYVGMAAIYAGLAVAMDSITVLALLPPTILLVQYGVIAREERYMATKFGAAYDAYRASVRRLI